MKLETRETYEPQIKFDDEIEFKFMQFLYFKKYSTEAVVRALLKHKWFKYNLIIVGRYLNG